MTEMDELANAALLANEESEDSADWFCPDLLDESSEPIRSSRRARAFIACASPKRVLALLALKSATEAYFAHVDEFRNLMTAGLKTEGDYRRFEALRGAGEAVEAGLRAALAEAAT